MSSLGSVTYKIQQYLQITDFTKHPVLTSVEISEIWLLNLFKNLCRGSKHGCDGSAAYPHACGPKSYPPREPLIDF